MLISLEGRGNSWLTRMERYGLGKGRQSLRLRSFDYAWAGSYVVTVSVADRACRFGQIIDGVSVLSDAGLMIESWWGNISRRFSGVSADDYVVMPNHFHGVVRIGFARDDDRESTEEGRIGAGNHIGLPLRTTSDEMGRAPSLGDVVGWFKTMTTNDYSVGVRRFGWPPYERRLWQRNYYEHVVRDEADLDRIQTYIATKPARWAEDEEYRQ